MKQSEAAKLVAVLVASYPRQPMPPGTTEAYENMLADLPFAETGAAVERWIKTQKYFPTIAEIRGAVADAETGRMAPAEAWVEVMEAVRRVGSYRTPKWSHPAIADAIRAMGGWQDFCASDDPQTVLRSQFLKLFDQLQARRSEDANVAGLLTGGAKVHELKGRS